MQQDKDIQKELYKKKEERFVYNTLHLTSLKSTKLQDQFPKTVSGTFIVPPCH